MTKCPCFYHGVSQCQDAGYLHGSRSTDKYFPKYWINYIVTPNFTTAGGILAMIVGYRYKTMTPPTRFQ